MGRWVIFCALACGCSAEQIEETEAVDDLAVGEMNESLMLHVLDNDVGIPDEIEVVIAQGPQSGEASVSDGVISYLPAHEYIGADNLRYELVENGEVVSAANVAIDVNCTPCMLGVSVSLRWLPLPPEMQVDGYRMYMNIGSDDEALMELIDDIGVDEPRYDNTDPMVTYDAWEDLRLVDTNLACFRLTAYNVVGESPFSNSVCKPMVKAAKEDNILFDL